MRPGVEIRQAAPVQTQVIDITGSIAFDMPEGFQLEPGFEMVDGIPEWMGGDDEEVSPRNFKGELADFESRVFISSDSYRNEPTWQHLGKRNLCTNHSSFSPMPFSFSLCNHYLGLDHQDHFQKRQVTPLLLPIPTRAYYRAFFHCVAVLSIKP
jgi:hypothetical protein